MKRLTERQMKKWVRALRSGLYEQGKNALCLLNEETETARYCCLGVMVEEFQGEDDWIYDGYGGLVSKSCDSRGNVAGLYDLGSHRGRPVHDLLTGFNDDGKSFKWIAAWIERTFSNWAYTMHYSTTPETESR